MDRVKEERRKEKRYFDSAQYDREELVISTE